jgi:NhaP-type Na+/H+ or K+/H+ antiporter
MFLSLFLIFIPGVIIGLIFDKMKLPKLIWYIILGIIIGPSVLKIVSESLLNISSNLRQIALIIILTRSGLSLDLNNLKKIGRSAILMCFLPACFEIAAVAIFGPLLLDINYIEALLLGSVLAAVSPAVVVPRMIILIEGGYGKKHNVPELILAGSSCDDIFVIVLFYSFKKLVAKNSFSLWTIAQIPISIVTGIALGIAIGFLMVFIIRKLKFNVITNVILILGFSFGMIDLEDELKKWFSISALLGVIVMALIISIFQKDEAKEIQLSYNSLWGGFEILLFSLVGCATDIDYAFSKNGAIIIGLVFIALIIRSLGVICCVIRTEFTFKERIFIIISYLPKATVQASIGGIALAEGLNCGIIVLTAAVISIIITAPLGAILMDRLYKKLLSNEEDV